MGFLCSEISIKQGLHQDLEAAKENNRRGTGMNVKTDFDYYSEAWTFL